MVLTAKARGPGVTGATDWLARAVSSCRVTGFTVVAALIATSVAGLGVCGDARDWPRAVTWLVHGDVRHLVLDVLALAAIGAWLEPRAGSRRVLVWIALAATVSVGSHGLMYPEQSRLFGTSAAGYTLVFAAVCGWALDRAWGVMLLLALVALLADELLAGRSGVLRSCDAAASVTGSEWGSSFIAGPPLTPTPRVHIACAGLGAALGWSVRRGRSVGNAVQTQNTTDPLQDPAAGCAL